MTATRWLIVGLFIVAFAAGGAVAWTLRPHSPRPSSRGGSFLLHELNLTAEQQKQMQGIWSNLGKDSWHQDAERRKVIQRQRDEAIRALIPADKKTLLDQILADYQKQMTDLGEQRRRNYEQAVEKTKAILTPEQRSKYEQILARRPEGRRSLTPGNPGTPGTPGALGNPGSGAGRPAAQPPVSDTQSSR